MSLWFNWMLLCVFYYSTTNNTLSDHDTQAAACQMLSVKPRQGHTFSGTKMMSQNLARSFSSLIDILNMSVIQQLTLKAGKHCIMFLKGSAMPRLCLVGKILTCHWARGETKTLSILQVFSLFNVKLYVSLYAIVIVMHKVCLLETFYAVFFGNQVGYRALLFYVSKKCFGILFHSQHKRQGLQLSVFCLMLTIVTPGKLLVDMLPLNLPIFAEQSSQFVLQTDNYHILECTCFFMAAVLQLMCFTLLVKNT